MGFSAARRYTNGMRVLPAVTHGTERTVVKLNSVARGSESTLRAGRIAESGTGGCVPLSAVSAPKLDTKETSLVSVPPDGRLYRPVRLTERAYRHQVAEHLRVYGRESDAPDAAKWLRRSFLLRGCGGLVLVLSCRECKVLNPKGARVVVSCGLRTCPSCARMRSGRRANKIAYAAERCERDGFGYFFLTFTQRFDVCSEEDLAVEGIRRRYDQVALGMKYVWKRVLKADGHALALSFEVGPGGVMHSHAIFYGREPDIRDVRAAWLLQVPDSPQVKSVRMPDIDQAVREVAKYIVKAASPKREGGKDGMGSYTDPELAAKVEIALHGRRLTETLGVWRGVPPPRGQLPQSEPTCPCCESQEVTEILMPREQVVRLLPPGSPIRFTHGGRRRRPKPRCGQAESSTEQRSEHGNDLQRATQQADALGSGDRKCSWPEPQDGARGDRERDAPCDPSRTDHPSPDWTGAHALGPLAKQQSWW